MAYTEIVTRLAQLLRENGERILVDHTPLSLTVSFLRFLDDALRSLSGDNEEFLASFEALPGNSPRVPHCHELQFLYDFIQKTPTLKLLSDSSLSNHGSGLVSLAMFRSLRELELKRTSVHGLLGISRLRGKLHKVICTRCLVSLQELLEDCGADQSTGLAWNQLTVLCLPYNSIAHLDSSLRLLPVLKILDLSHNQIRDSHSHLEHLTELTEANLGYNLLCAVPSFSLSSRGRLTTLGLQHNSLENIEGIQELTGLQQLDLSHNCLTSHTQLQPLAFLSGLRVLMLLGNPLSLHPKHRPLTIEQIHPQAVKNFVLDQRPVTENEAMFAGKVHSRGVSRPLPRRPTQIARDQSQLPVNYTPYVRDDMSTDQSDTGNSRPFSDILTDTSSINNSVSKKATKRKTRARSAEISEIDDVLSDDSARSIPRAAVTVTTEPQGAVGTPRLGPDLAQYGTPYSDQDHMKEQAQKLRNIYGDSWLQIVAEKDNPRAEKPTMESTSDKKPVRDSINRDTETDSADTKNPENSSAVENSSNELDSNDAEPNFVENVVKISNDQINEHSEETSAGSVAQTTQADSSVFVEDIAQAEPESEPEPAPREESRHRASATPDNTDFVWSRNDSEGFDYGQEGEPYIIKILGPDITMATENNPLCLLTVTARYILEKDVEGVVMEALDLKCLRNAQVMPSHRTGVKRASGEQGEEVLQLLFDYYRRDRAERRYVMESKEAAQSLLDTLQPYIDFRQIGEDLKERVKCLKCGAEFSMKDDVGNWRPDKASSGLPPCPSCQSDLVVEMDLGQVARSVGRHGGGEISMLHGQAKHSTPVKGVGNRQLFGVTPPRDTSLPKTSSTKSLQSLNSQAPKIIKSLTSELQDSEAILSSEPQGQSQGIGIQRRNTDDEVLSRQLSVSSDIAVLPREEEHELNLSPIPDTREAKLPSPEITPCGSLSNKAISSMVSSMYENSLPTAASPKIVMTTASPTKYAKKSDNFHSFDNHDSAAAFRSCVDSEDDTPNAEDPGLIRFTEDDFSNVDHRLLLHLNMNVFHDEEVQLVLKCDIIQFNKPQEFTGLLVITNKSIFIMKVTGEPRAESIPSWLVLVQKQSLLSLGYIEIGFQGQSFRLEQARGRSDGGGSTATTAEFFVCLVRDKQRCKHFMKPFTALIKQIASTDGSQLEGIKTDRVTRGNIGRDILDPEEGEVDSNVRLYILCHQQIGAFNTDNVTLSPVSIIVTPTHIAMATENHHLDRNSDLDSESGKKKKKSKQFEPKDIQLITNITTIETSRSCPSSISITFTEEDSNDEYTWRLKMATCETNSVLIATLTELWEKLFGGVEIHRREIA